MSDDITIYAPALSADLPRGLRDYLDQGAPRATLPDSFAWRPGISMEYLPVTLHHEGSTSHSGVCVSIEEVDATSRTPRGLAVTLTAGFTPLRDPNEHAVLWLVAAAIARATGGSADDPQGEEQLLSSNDLERRWHEAIGELEVGRHAWSRYPYDLFVACMSGSNGDVTRLLSAEDIAARDSNGATPLLLALQGGDVEIVDTLLTAGADANASNAFGKTALQYAGPRTSLLKRLVAAGADGGSELLRMSGKGVVPMVDALLESGVDPNATTPQGWTALMCAAYSGNPACVERILAVSPDVDRAESRGLTALMVAADRRLVVIARRLLAAGADRSRRTIDGMSAADFAKGEPELVALLESSGA